MLFWGDSNLKFRFHVGACFSPYLSHDNQTLQSISKESNEQKLDELKFYINLPLSQFHFPTLQDSLKGGGT